MLNWGKKEKRLDPAYYIPSIVALEEKVLRKATKNGVVMRLRHYIKNMAGGATPKVEDESKYSDADNGIPFIRVQNLSTEGVLSLEDVKYISKDTHEKDLKRSGFNDQDLLVKITGVGRMAIASVPNEGCIGNINQHSVRIVTGDRTISETIAAYLNLDFVEKLASRRATGGTRPALDYPALRSIPIIFDERIAEMVRKARETKQDDEKNAQDLLDGIDSYLLSELGIVLPEKPENTIDNRKFTRGFFEISGKRFDPRYNKDYFIKYYRVLNTAKYNAVRIKDISSSLCSGSTPRAGGDDYTDSSGVPFIRVTDLKNNTISFSNVLYIKHDIHRKTLKRSQLSKGDVLLSIAGTIGLSVVVPAIENANINQAIAKIRVNNDLINEYYLSEILNSTIGRIQTDRLSRPAVQSNLNFEEIKQILIPLPKLEIQTLITSHIKTIRDNSNNLKQNSDKKYLSALNDIGQLILNEND